MKMKPLTWMAALAAAGALPVLGSAQGSDLGDRVMALKASLERDSGVLRKMEWIETTSILYKGEEKSNKQERCYYGAEGKLQKVPVAQTQADTPGGLRGRAAKRKKEDVTEYMQRAAGLIHQYVPPDPAVLQKVYQGGKVSGQILEPGKRNRLTFNSYLVPNDQLSIDVNMANNHILALQVATYLDDPEDTVSLAVQFANLVDGTGYPSQITLDATKQNVRVVTQKSGYRPMQQ